MKTKVEFVTIGIYNVDSITVKLNNKITEICFDKSVNVKQYEGKEIELTNKNGIYTIKEIKSNK